MTNSAFVEATIRCEGCGASLGDSASIAWGLCGPTDFNAGASYRVGDLVEWRADLGALPVAYTAFSGPVAMVNHGDPATSDCWLLDAEHIADGDSLRCANCSADVVVLVQIRNGAIASAASCVTTDERVETARSLSVELNSVSYQTVTWNHGLTDRDLAEVDAFFGGVGLSEMRADTSDGQVLRNDAIDAALLESFTNFSRRLACHGAARWLNTDPYLVDRRLVRILRSVASGVA